MVGTLITGCGPTSLPAPAITELARMVPDAMPEGVEVQEANNNLDVVRHEGRVYLAFRTAPSHFASAETRLHVVSSDDEVTWRHEATFFRSTDLREPRFLSWNGELFLYFAVLGDNLLDFEPQGMMASQLQSDGSWSEPQWRYEPGFIPWRVGAIDGTPSMVGYVGGEAIYDVGGATIDIHWLTTDDGVTWRARYGDDPVVQTGGGSETALTQLDDGRVVAVVRNEAGDELGSTGRRERRSSTG